MKYSKKVSDSKNLVLRFTLRKCIQIKKKVCSYMDNKSNTQNHSIAIIYSDVQYIVKDLQ